MCLGTMMFGGRADKEESLKIIDHAMDRGVNFIDTANVYAATRANGLSARRWPATGNGGERSWPPRHTARRATTSTIAASAAVT